MANYIDSTVFINGSKNAALLESLGYEIYWNSKFGHRCNEQAAKQIKTILSKR